jgi:hypothetical protein
MGIVACCCNRSYGTHKYEKNIKKYDRDALIEDLLLDNTNNNVNFNKRNLRLILPPVEESIDIEN